MIELTTFLRWLIEYSVSDGFWHFAAVYLIVALIVRLFAFVRVNVKKETKKD